MAAITHYAFAPTPDIAARMWARIRFEGACWLDANARAGHYGTLPIEGEQWTMHRAAWVLWRGPIPPGKSVLHSCDTPECWRPCHLWLGTQRDNMEDRDRKGRGVLPPPTSLLGECNPQARLTADQVRAIRANHAAGTCSQSALARIYDVSPTTIRDILQGRRWAHVA